MSAMYLHNKYTNWYNNIIARAQSRTLDGYKERHHIIPKSLGGSNAPENLVDLTAREHYICHLLLTKMLPDEHKSKMVFAAWGMANLNNDRQQRQYRITNRIYEILKEQKSKYSSQIMKENNPMRNPEVRAKHKHSSQNRDKSGGMTGRHHSQETRDKMRLSSLGQVHSNESRAKIREARAKQVITEETKAKMKASQLKRWAARKATL